MNSCPEIALHSHRLQCGGYMVRKHWESTIMWFFDQTKHLLVFYGRCGLASSIILKHSGFLVSQIQQAVIFFTAWFAHHECNMSLISHLLHTRMIIFVCFVNIQTILLLLIVETSMVFIINKLWSCIHPLNISIKVLPLCWYYYLRLFISRIIFFTMQIYSNFLVAL